jgi:hypothetical protein
MTRMQREKKKTGLLQLTLLLLYRCVVLYMHIPSMLIATSGYASGVSWRKHLGR